MRKVVCSLLIFLVCKVPAQTNNENITLSFTNEPIEEVFRQIEAISTFTFFYLEDWISQRTVSGDYQDKSVRFVVEDLLKNTDSNFFITDDKRIILTGNNVIFDVLPNSFDLPESKDLNNSEKEVIRDDVPVIFDTSKNVVTQSIETIRIGKANKNSVRRLFTLEGKIRDFTSGNGLSQVSIRILGTSVGTTSNANGNFSIELPIGENLVEISSLGYQKETKRIFIYNDGTVEFDLSESLELLDEVIIDADVDANTREIISGVTKLDVESLKTIPVVLGERDILKVATALPGISKAGEGSQGYNVRGGREDQNLILLDGAAIYNPSHFFGLFSALNPFSVGDVEIYKGNIPAEFGGRLSSVFDLKSRNPDKTKLVGEASIGPVTSNLSLQIPVVKEKSSVLIGGRGAYSNWVLKLLDDEQLSNSSASFYDFIFKYDHKVNDKTTISATGYYSKDDFSITSDSLYGYKNGLASVQWNKKINDKNTVNLHLTYSSFAFNIDYDGNANNDFNLGYKLSEGEIKLKSRYLYSKDCLLYTSDAADD